MAMHLLAFVDPRDGIPTWAIVLAFALLSLAAALPTPERAGGPSGPALATVAPPASS